VRGVVLTGLAGGRDVFIEQDHVPHENGVSPQDFLDDLAVAGVKNGRRR